MKDLPSAHVSEVAALLRTTSHDALSVGDALQLAEAMATSYGGFIRDFDAALYAEVAPIADAISVMRRDVARLAVADLHHDRIPDAGRELDAVVKATESASDSIMSAAEDLLGADRSDPDGFAALVDDKATAILEACAFQDITGQRIAKVVRTLAFIEQHVTHLMAQLRAGGYVRGERDETPEERRARELMLHGPQIEGDGVAQDDIDALFAADEADQSEIDALFS